METGSMKPKMPTLHTAVTKIPSCQRRIRSLRLAELSAAMEDPSLESPDHDVDGDNHGHQDQCGGKQSLPLRRADAGFAELGDNQRSDRLAPIEKRAGYR